MSELGIQDVRAAAERVKPFAHRTPVMTSSALDDAAGGSVFFKCENFQRTGSFKFRGACNAVSGLLDAARSRGVVTHSSGNHAQALALAAHLHDVQATIVMPENAPKIKRSATEGYGARVEACAPTHHAREETAGRIQRETGAVFVSAHDDPFVIAGQGTAVLELLADTGDLDVILAPVGGGGLLSGTLLAAKGLNPAIQVIGCEPAGADDAYRSLESGKRIVDFVPRTIADGLRTPLGERAFGIIQRLVDRIVRVEEEEIVHAMRTVWERMKIIIEPSSAVAVAPLLSKEVLASGKRVGVILSGGNVDLERFFASGPAGFQH